MQGLAVAPAERVEILVTGVVLDEFPDPEATLDERVRISGARVTPEQRGHLAAWRQGSVVFVRSTPFVEFRGASGEQRWEGTPQGPSAVTTARSATSALLELAEDAERTGLLAELRSSGHAVSRFDFEAAPQRIDADPALVARLSLD